MKLIPTNEAVGHVLCHDLTQIIPGVVKDARFRKGHIVTEEDIPVLLSMGKENLYVWENDETKYHEDEAAEILYSFCKNEHITRSRETKEGKIELFADCDGLFRVDVERVNRLNSLGEMMIATRQNNFPVRKGDKLAGTRVIPLVIEKSKMEAAKEAMGAEPLFKLLPYQHKKVGIVTTGSEVSKGRIKDQFGPAVLRKLAEFDTEIMGQVFPGDDKEAIAEAVTDFVARGADLVVCTGGMSVDPDDNTPGAIRAAGARIVSYGAPVLPGAMFLMAYAKNGTPIVGLPGCVMYAKRTIFDLVLPYVMANEPVTAEDLNRLGVGGLCLGCDVCVFPNCGFGR